MVTENLPPSGSLVGAPLESPFNGWKIVKEDPVEYKDMNPRGLEFVFGAVKEISGDNPNPMNRLVGVYQKPSEGDYVIVSKAVDNPNDMRIFDITNEWYGDPEPGPEHLFKKVMEMADNNNEGMIETADDAGMKRSMNRNMSEYGEFGKVDSYIETAGLFDTFKEKMGSIFGNEAGENPGKNPSASLIRQHAGTIEKGKELEVIDRAVQNAHGKEIEKEKQLPATRSGTEVGKARKVRPGVGGDEKSDTRDEKSNVGGDGKSDTRGGKPGLGSPTIDAKWEDVTGKKKPSDSGKEPTNKPKGKFDWKGAQGMAKKIGKVAGAAGTGFLYGAAHELARLSPGGKTANIKPSFEPFGKAVEAVKGLYTPPKKSSTKTSSKSGVSSSGSKGSKAEEAYKTSDFNKNKNTGEKGKFWK